MSLSIHDELRRTFELATLRQEARYIETPDQWKRAATLQMLCESVRTREKDLYAARYHSRVETRRAKLIADGAQVQRKFRPQIHPDNW